jgi:hypothetical protein
MFWTKVVDEIETRVFVINNFFFENRALFATMWKMYCRAGQAIGDNTAHAHYTLDS